MKPTPTQPGSSPSRISLLTDPLRADPHQHVRREDPSRSVRRSEPQEHRGCAGRGPPKPRSRRVSDRAEEEHRAEHVQEERKVPAVGSDERQHHAPGFQIIRTRPRSATRPTAVVERERDAVADAGVQLRARRVARGGELARRSSRRLVALAARGRRARRRSPTARSPRGSSRRRRRSATSFASQMPKPSASSIADPIDDDRDCRISRTAARSRSARSRPQRGEVEHGDDRTAARNMNAPSTWKTSSQSYVSRAQA